MPSASTPSHLAIIMDGNRRWAYQRSQSTRFGHENGSKVIDGISRKAYDNGVKWLTLFAFSSENWRRSSLELRGIMAVLKHYLTNEMHSLMDNNVRLRVVGDLTGFSDDIVALLNEAVIKTSGNTGLNLTVALGYGGQADLVAAAQRLAQKAADGQVNPHKIDADALKAELSTAPLPAVDLLLRTGKEQRISNFLLWDMAYAELFFSDVLWPDFTAEILEQILKDYANRTRRFGGDGHADDTDDADAASALSSSTG